MKTTLEIPDTLFRRAKAAAAVRGQSLKQLVTQAVRKELDAGTGRKGTVKGWRAFFGAVPGSAAEIDRIVEKEFEQIDPDDWK